MYNKLQRHTIYYKSHNMGLLGCLDCNMHCNKRFPVIESNLNITSDLYNRYKNIAQDMNVLDKFVGNNRLENYIRISEATKVPGWFNWVCSCYANRHIGHLIIGIIENIPELCEFLKQDIDRFAISFSRTQNNLVIFNYHKCKCGVLFPDKMLFKDGLDQLDDIVLFSEKEDTNLCTEPDYRVITHYRVITPYIRVLQYTQSSLYGLSANIKVGRFNKWVYDSNALKIHWIV